VSCTIEWMQRNTHPICKMKKGTAFGWESGGWEAKAYLHTTRGIAQIFLRVVFNVASGLNDIC